MKAGWELVEKENPSPGLVPSGGGAVWKRSGEGYDPIREVRKATP